MPTVRRENFKMNRKCAAGTGAFLEEVAQRMDVPLDQIDSLARQASEARAYGKLLHGVYQNGDSGSPEGREKASGYCGRAHRIGRQAHHWKWIRLSGEVV